MHRKALELLQTECRLDPARPVVAGVSGGPDSLCLLDVLQSAGIDLVVAHFNHKLRPDADEDARFVQTLAGERGLPFVLETADVAGYADEHSLSIEEAARILRYRFLFRVARQHQAQAVAVGHTADDQAETILMHFLRGAGLNGLRGMRPRALLPGFDPEIPLVRPLLGLWREDTLACCAERGLHARLDASNDSLAYLRNRLRHALMPVLETYNPRIREILCRMGRTLDGDYEILAEAVDQLWESACQAEGPGYVTLDAAALTGTSAGSRRNLLRRALERVRPGLQGLDFETLERAAAFAVQPDARQTDLTAGVRLLREGNRLYVAAWEAGLPNPGWPQLTPGAPPLQLDWPGVWQTGAWRLNAERPDSPALAWEQARANPDPYQAWLDADRLHGALHLRPPRPGERFQPLGMSSGSLKLSDFFVNAKLPRRARAGWPLVCDEEGIVWIPGFRPAQACRLRPETRNVLYLSLRFNS